MQRSWLSLAWRLGINTGTAARTKTQFMPDLNQELSFGQKAVGLTFNPGGHPEVENIKTACATIIDQLNDARAKTESGDKKRMYSEAITAIQTGQMWGVKAATWPY